MAKMFLILLCAFFIQGGNSHDLEPKDYANQVKVVVNEVVSFVTSSVTTTISSIKAEGNSALSEAKSEVTDADNAIKQTVDRDNLSVKQHVAAAKAAPYHEDVSECFTDEPSSQCSAFDVMPTMKECLDEAERKIETIKEELSAQITEQKQKIDQIKTQLATCSIDYKGMPCMKDCYVKSGIIRTETYTQSELIKMKAKVKFLEVNAEARKCACDIKIKFIEEEADLVARIKICIAKICLKL